jgi:molybdopterin-binding protein
MVIAFLCAGASTPRHTGQQATILRGMTGSDDRAGTRLRVGRAAEMLGVSVETLRRWETEGRLRMERSDGGQRLVGIDEVSRLLVERRRASTERPIVAQSARNRFPGVVTRIEKDRVAAVVEVIAGPHRMVSLMTAEAVDELGLKVGDEAVCVVKATNVIVEIPSARELRA